VVYFENDTHYLCTVTVDLGMWWGFPCPWEVEVTSEQKVFWRGVAAGTITGVVIGLMMGLFIMIRPELARALIP
jgi:uncharacterized membrane protein